MFYNFVRIHSTVRMSPAMAAGVSDRLWEMSDIVDWSIRVRKHQSDRQPTESELQFDSYDVALPACLTSSLFHLCLLNSELSNDNITSSNLNLLDS